MTNDSASTASGIRLPDGSKRFTKYHVPPTLDDDPVRTRYIDDWRAKRAAEYRTLSIYLSTVDSPGRGLSQ